MPSACWKNPVNKDKGSAKSALLPTAPSAAAPPVPNVQTDEELKAKKAAKKEKNKRYKERKKEKKEEEKKKIEEAKAAQTAAFTVTSEEDSPRKTPFASRNHRVLGSIAKKSLFQDLKEMTEEDTAIIPWLRVEDLHVSGTRRVNQTRFI